jgi:glutamyl-tRNA synthetase
MSAEEIAVELKPLLESEGLYSPDLVGEQRTWYLALIELLKSRARTLLELIERARPFLTDEFTYDEDAIKKHLSEVGVRDRLERLRVGLADLPDWTEKSLEETTRRVGDEMGIAAAKLIHPTRVALTGKTVSPGIFQVMEAIGRERALRRIDRLVEFLSEKVH